MPTSQPPDRPDVVVTRSSSRSERRVPDTPLVAASNVEEPAGALGTLSGRRNWADRFSLRLRVTVLLLSGLAAALVAGFLPGLSEERRDMLWGLVVGLALGGVILGVTKGPKERKSV